MARAVRDRTSECLLIAVTGYGDKRERERGRQAGFQHYLVKPADPDLIDELLSGEPMRSLETCT